MTFGFFEKVNALKQLHLTGSLVMSWPFDEDEHMMEYSQFMILSGHFEQLTFQCDELVHTFATLAQFGAQAAAQGSYLLLLRFFLGRSTPIAHQEKEK